VISKQIIVQQQKTSTHINKIHYHKHKRLHEPTQNTGQPNNTSGHLVAVSDEG